MKLIVAGSRDCTDYGVVAKHLRQVLSKTNYNNITIVCGEARGADALGKRFAKDHTLNIISMPALWDVHGKSAGYRRNEEMAKVATHCICFWDGVSRGTKHMIDLANRYKLNLRVIKY